MNKKKLKTNLGILLLGISIASGTQALPGQTPPSPKPDKNNAIVAQIAIGALVGLLAIKVIEQNRNKDSQFPLPTFPVGSAHDLSFDGTTFEAPCLKYSQISTPIQCVRAPCPAQPLGCFQGLKSCEDFGTNKGLLSYTSQLLSKVENEDYASNVLSKRRIKDEALGIIDRKIWGYYHGKDFDIGASTEAELSGNKYPNPICNPMDQSELKDCGAPMTFRKKPLSSSYEIDALLDDTQGVLESSYLRGAWVQALKCYKRQVQDEILTGSLKISAGNQSSARAISNTYAFLKEVSAHLPRVPIPSEINSTLSLSAAALSGSVQAPVSPGPGCFMNCASDYGGSASDCRLWGIQSQIESAFALLATQEVYTRADQHYSMLFSDEPADSASDPETQATPSATASSGYQQNVRQRTGLFRQENAVVSVDNGSKFINMMSRDLVGHCQTEAANACRERLLPMVKFECTIQNFDLCYKQTVKGFMKNWIQLNFPNDGKCALNF